MGGQDRMTPPRYGYGVDGYVFISYRHGDDVAYVKRLTEFLVDAAVRVWHDHDVVTGDRWEQVIKTKIEDCSAFIVVMTPGADESDWVKREINYAERLGRPILPLLLEGNGFFRLNNYQAEDVRQGQLPTQPFVNRLKQLVAPQRNPAEDADHRGDIAATLACRTGIVMDNEVVPGAPVSSLDASPLDASLLDASDPHARAALEREREDAQRLADGYRGQVDELHAERTRLLSSLEEIEAGAAKTNASYARDVGTLMDDMRLVREQIEARDERSARLAREIEELQQLGERLRQERDAARNLADERYREIEEVRQAARAKEQELRRDIQELDDQTRMLRSTVLQLESERTASISTPKLEEVLRAVADIRNQLGGGGAVPKPETRPGALVGGEDVWNDEDGDAWGDDDAVAPHLLQ
jgi:hypothetical protein